MSIATDIPPRTTLTLFINGQAVETSQETLAALLLEQGYGEAKVATARNGTFVAQRMRAATRLEAGDRIEVVSARQGG